METRLRASTQQFATLLEFMESHGDIAKVQPGPAGVLRALRLWKKLAHTLNSARGGIYKSPDKWKKVWTDWKSKTKKKALQLQMMQTEFGGPTSRPLSSLEKRLLVVMGQKAVEGDPETEDQRFDVEIEPRLRASCEQFATLLEYMENNGDDLLKSQPGVLGNLRFVRAWQKLADTLNSVCGGVIKSADKWKKVWADWKSKTKKKGEMRQLIASGTGKGPVYISALEERLLVLLRANSEKEKQGSDTLPQPISNPELSADLNLQLEVKNELPVPSPFGLLSSDPLELAAASTSEQQLLMTAPTTSPPTSPQPPPRAPSPHSSVTSTGRSHRRARRRQGPTPFQRATSEFVSVEHRRLRLEEMRERNEARRIEVEHERNEVLSRLVNIAQGFLDHYVTRNSTERLDSEWC